MNKREEEIVSSLHSQAELEKFLWGFKNVSAHFLPKIRDIGLDTTDITDTLVDVYVSGHCVTSEGKRVYLRKLTQIMMGSIEKGSNVFVLEDEKADFREKPHPSRIVAPINGMWKRVVLIFENRPPLRYDNGDDEI